MRTAEEMVHYCDAHGTGTGFSKRWRLKHFKIIEHQLKDDEDVEVAFIGIKNYKSITEHEDNWAYAVTNKRLLIGQKGLIGEKVDVISLRDLNDISFKKGLAFGVLTIDTIKEEFNVGLNKVNATIIHNLVTNALMDKTDELNNIKTNVKQEPKSEKSVTDPYEEVKKLKELLDMDVITEDEFNAKKKDVLGL